MAAFQTHLGKGKGLPPPDVARQRDDHRSEEGRTALIYRRVVN